MGKEIEGYKSKFKQETVEMSVRISWCYEKGELVRADLWG